MNINETKEKYAVNTADEAIKMIVGLGYDYDGFSNEKDLKSLIDELVELAVLAKSLMHVPAADGEPVRHGHWIPHKTIVRSPFVKNYDCSECGHESFAYPNCPYCRAIMDGKEQK